MSGEPHHHQSLPLAGGPSLGRSGGCGRPRFPVGRWVPLLLALTLAGCAAKRDFRDVPDIPLPERFRHAPELVLPPSVSSALQAKGIRLQRLRKELLGLSLPNEVLFDFDSAELKAGAKPALGKLVEVLGRHRATVVRVVGHTDAEGSAEYNRELSLRRARSVVAYFTAAGVDAARLEAVGEGEARPRADNADAAGRRLNRRVEVAPPPPAEEEKPVRALESVLSEWWRLLGDAELDRLIDRALAHNTDLRIAALRVTQAKARADQDEAARWPTITAPMQAKGEAPEGGIGSVRRGEEPRTRHLYQASLRADWRPDLWGELASQAESGVMEVWRAAFQHDETRRRMVADIVSAYVEYLSLNDRIQVAHETRTVLDEMLGAMAQRLERGDATVTDVEQQRAAVLAVEATIPALELRREQVHNRLALLVGGVPGGLKLPTERGLDALARPRVLPGVPASLVLRRPDVRVVEARLLGADADIDLARARLLPPLDLTAQVGYGSLYLSQLFDAHTLFWNAIANLSITLFDHGERSREVDFARAVHEEMVETYARTLYTALVEVEDALITIQLTDRRLDIQQRAARAARKAWQLSRESYEAGAIDYLALLDSERTYHRNLDEAHQIHRERYQGLVDLFAALGGGVEGREPLPGEGERPVPEAWERNGVVVEGDPAPPLVSGWRGAEPPAGGAARWLVELSGLHDRAAVDAGWRDLSERHGDLLAGRRLLLVPEEGESLPESETPRGEWFRLFIAEFSEPARADALCARLRDRQHRCRVVSSTLVEIGDRGLQWPLVDEAGGGAPEVSVAQPVVSKVEAEVVEAPAVEPPAPAEEPVTPAAVEPAPADGEVYAVQVGSFSGEENARRALIAWRDKGYDAYLRPVEDDEGTVWNTVRIGLFEHSLAAAAAEAVSRREGVRAVTVPVAAAGDEADVAWSFDREGYAVQLGAFGNPNNARNSAEQWRRRGFQAYVQPMTRKQGDPWYAVRLGAFDERPRAKALALGLAEADGVDGWVIPVELDRDGEPRPLIFGERETP